MVKISWADSSSASGWQPLEDEMGVLICTSVGFIQAKDKNSLTIIQSTSPDSEGNPARGSGYLNIPLSVIKKIENLRAGRPKAARKPRKTIK